MATTLIIIGGGPAGYVGAIRAAQLGMEVTLIEEAALGGTCLNRGCIPTKSLLHASGLYHSARTMERFGIKAAEVVYDLAQIYRQKEQTVETLCRGIASLLKANGVRVIFDRAVLVDAHTVRLSQGDELGADAIIIATGGAPVRPAIPGITQALSSDDVLDRPTDAQRIAIIGGGVIGVELAQHYAQLGREVVVYEFQDRLIAFFDTDISKQMTLSLKRLGVKVCTQSAVRAIEPTEGDGYRIEALTKGKTQTDEVDLVLCCVGRRPIGIPSLSSLFDTSAEGAIVVDDNFRTKTASLYAVGDTIGGYQLAHVASAQAIIAVEHIAYTALPTRPEAPFRPSIDSQVIPSCIYTQPEAAAVGATEEQLLATYSAEQLQIGRYLINGNGKAMISGEHRGLVKTIFCRQSGRLLGAHLFAPHATDMIHELALAMTQGLTHHDLSRLIHAHPTLAESILESVEAALGCGIHTLPSSR